MTSTAQTVAATAVAQAWYQRQQAIARKVAEAVQAWWAELDPNNLTASYASLWPRIVTIVSAGQMLAAMDTDAYAGQALSVQGALMAPVGLTDARAFAGVASDGTDLATLLYGPLIGVKQDIGLGVPVDRAVMRGRVKIVRLAAGQTQDAGRSSVGVASVQRGVTSYVRMLTLPSCSRCVVLAGSTWHWAQAFERHPNCDCINVPIAEDTTDDLRTDPLGYFRSLDAAEQDRTFTIAGAQAIRDGANIGQVVNARSGMQTVLTYGRPTLVTTSGTTKRGLAGKRLAGQRTPRLMPEQIYLDAHGDRGKAIALLQRFGYIV